MKTRKNLMVLVLLSLFLSVGVADSEVSKKENPVILKLYEKLQKADSDIDESVLDDLKTMLNNDGKIGVDELVDTFGDDLINIDFISDISKDSQISPYLKQVDISDEAIEKLLADNKELHDKREKLKKIKASADAHKKSADAHKKSADAHKKSADAHKKSADAHKKSADAHRKLTDTINRTLKALGGD